MNIKVYDEKEIHPKAFALLEQHGHSFVTNPKDAEAILIRTATHADKSFLDKHPKLKHLLRVGVGLDTIDVDECKKRKIVVLNSAGANANAVAEFTLALMLSCLRKIPLADAHVRAKKWERFSFKTTELTSKTIGLVGFGAIPKLVAKKLQGWDVHILAYDPFLSKEQVEIFPNVEKVNEFHQLLQKSFVISIHVPLSKETASLIGEQELKLLKKGTLFINTSRGGIVDEAALIKKLKTGTISAALDVFSEEPFYGDKTLGELLKLKNVILTPHVAAMTEEAHEAMAVEVVEKFAEMVGSKTRKI